MDSTYSVPKIQKKLRHYGPVSLVFIYFETDSLIAFRIFWGPIQVSKRFATNEILAKIRLPISAL